MDEEQIARLVAVYNALAAGQYLIYDLNGVFLSIQRIGMHADEDGPVAYCSDGGYCWLGNCEPENFLVMKPIRWEQ